MAKCEHMTCEHKAEIHGLCRTHYNWICEDSKGVELCMHCGSLIAVYERGNDSRKYVFALRCRKCGGTVEDEQFSFP